MYLTRIEMTGFKSFADKTVIEFDRGMTAVVGPNGSGKSNLSEAIRWVLGEQSAKSLRGSRMEDVIFNGTQARKAVNRAKVTLVFNNEDRYLDYDFSEIALSRSYNRNGDSRYSINNETVRLKDIVDLLLDSGLGKDSFSIISQGQVEQIFLNKPEERRTIFEEAAGVQKYQYRKNEAEAKLNKSQDHLNRVKDIIHELELQIDPLREQREAALKFQEFESQLQSLEVSLYTHQIEEDKEIWTQKEAEYKELQADYEKLVNHLKKDQDKLNEVKIEENKLHLEIEALNAHYQDQIQQYEQLKAQSQMIQQQIDFQSSSASQQEEDQASQEQKKETLDQQIKLLEEECIGLVTRTESMKTVLADLQENKAGLLNLNKESETDLRGQLIDLYQQQANNNNQINQLKDSMDRDEKTKQAGLIEVKKYRDSQEEYEESSQVIKSQLSDLNEQLVPAKQKHGSLLDQIQALRHESQDKESQIYQLERQIHQIRARLEALKANQEEYTGYYQGVRAVMKARGQLSGIDGPVSDLIKVPPKFQQAIDIALGASQQHIVVQDDRAARQAVHFLKENRAGRATFLPRTNIKPRQLNFNHLDIAQGLPGFIGIASQLIEFNKIDQAIIDNLLGTTVVVDNLVHGQEMAKSLQHRVRIVTLDGDLLNPGGSVTGGKNKNQAPSMLARRNELDRLEVDLAQYEKDLALKESDREQDLQQVKRLEIASQKVSQSVDDLTSQIQALQAELDQMGQQQKKTQQGFLIAQDEYQSAHKSLLDAKEQLARAEEMKQQLENNINDLDHKLSQLDLDKDQRQKQLDECNQKINLMQTDLAINQEQIRQKNERKAELQQEFKEIEQLLLKLSQQTSLSKKSSKELADQLRKTQIQEKEQAEALETSKQNLELKRDQRQTLIDKRQALEISTEQLHKNEQETFKLSTRLENQIDRLKEAIDKGLDHLSQAYQLSYEAALQQASPVDQPEASKKAILKLKKNIQSLGPINLQAIDDFAVLDERYQKLLEQETDLLTAMEQLHQTMQEMDQEVISRFSKTFHAINDQFKLSFQRLFAGGSAYLELTDPKDYLTTGVDIIAQPPGKRKQKLALLSGGERALTAIALLFAILEVKPVPFVVLDEVEAALDDANVYRYGEYIQNFTQQTQFIVITHRKGTMEHADVLYGVTMEQSGVSKLASVRLSEASKELEEDE
ncbi:chromosome segregation protein SMC [Hutsoniella sourekii]|uniref:chromosome segregation protein SMC n=1 Tax=Hutsoniella sourekii TaxID=87650 RepID=UPI0004864DFF|nr:chromosome segregation protein SMC [Hutsoniella sourekii]